ncbi:E3 ubiquitin-protein ligase RNF123 isoform X2 [Nilaparvata lugens]|uniref:E3 ubiquitin-protein ligase RNF123 isoform X2 n=1 Tax=Nilaparvata lugens TaxID=108931 RepID=UPI000B9856FA|nr:E3 ubiquitin-protein ligase RNF123 isoform X2 [Nilaparvata lugens]
MENAESVKDQERRAFDVAFETDFIKRVDVENIIESVFGPEISQEVFSLHGVFEKNFKTSSVLECVQSCVRRNLEQIEEEIRDLEPIIDTRRGRLGSKEVRFDVNSHVGLFVVGTDRLSINSQSNFSTLRANVCFYEGKWHYEVQLGSKGIMQIGWALGNCKFSQEIGVGDTINSYSFDGHRVRRWNVSTYSYGESWVSGDVIGSTIDLETGSIEFYRNGHSMGEAFKNIQMGPGYAYFPAVSLAFGENLVANFGSTPFKYQVAGYHSPERAPSISVAKADLLLKWFKNLLVYSDPRYQPKDATEPSSVSSEGITMIFGHLLMQHLAPLLSMPFVVEASLMPFLMDLGRKAVTPGKKAPSRTVTAVWLNMFLDMFWLFLDAWDQKQCLESVASYLLSRFRSVSFSVEYTLQKETLHILTLLCRHSKTRVFLIQNVLFDKVKFANLSHMKPLDAKGLCEAVPCPYWKGIEEEIVDGEGKLKRYLDDCEKLKAGIIAVENMQKELLIALMDNCDGTREQPSSRRLFLRKYRQYLHDTMLFSKTLPVVATPLPIVLCCFHRLVTAAQSLLERELPADAAEFSIPVRSFLDRSLNHFNIERFGGVMSHLRKVHAQEIAQELGDDHPINAADRHDDVHMCTSIVPRIPPAQYQAAPSGTVTVTTLVNPQTTIATTMTDIDGGSAIQDTMPNNTGYMLPLLARMIQNQLAGGPLPLILRGHALIPSCSTMEKATPAGAIDPQASLIELVDGLVLFYHLCAHKQLIKVSSLRDNMEEIENSLEEMKVNLNKLSPFSTAQPATRKSIEVLEEKLTEMSRHMAWVRAAIFSPEKQAELAWLLRIVIRTLQGASSKGKLLSFVPEFYLDTLIELTTALRSLFCPTVPIDNIPDWQSILMDVGEFVCTHFADPRIVHASCKDTLVQSLAAFVCCSSTLKCLEMLPLESRSAMICGLLRPYENRAWAQSNWVLVRFWQGNGFAFRYNKSPHLTTKFGPRDIRLDGSLVVQPIADPCPSVVFQQQISDSLINDEKLATAFINSILNQLNWAFSEFIGMLQEIQNLTSRPERPDRVLIESRQLKICATCFDLTLSLLRVLEMMASIARPLFTNTSRESSETLLERMCQLLCQVLNRISSITGCFQYVVDMEIAELESVDHFPILTAVIGILLALLQDELGPGDYDEESSLLDSSQRLGTVSRALLSEPSFQMSSLQFVLGQQLPSSSTSKLKSSLSSSRPKTFSFASYPNDITYMELEQVREMIAHLTWCQNKLSLAKEEDEDTLCSICYAYPTTATFHPCEHVSCRLCIKHHLMNNKDCFFCKTIIKKVTMADGTVLFNSEEPCDTAGCPSDLTDES